MQYPYCRYVEGVRFPIGCLRKDYLSADNGIGKGQDLDLGAEPPHIKMV